MRIVRDNGEELWLVPERTGEHEKEITIADLRMFHAVRQAFPGCTIEEIRKP